MMIEIADKDNTVMLDIDEVLWIMEIKKEEKTWYSAGEDEYTLIKFRNGEELFCSIRYDIVRKALDKFCPIHIGEVK